MEKQFRIIFSEDSDYFVLPQDMLQ